MLRHWHLDHNKPLALQIAADARLTQTTYTDDQSWQIFLGKNNESAMALQTRYGGRAGLISLVPMWVIEGQTIYETQMFHGAPVVTEFAPGYIRIESALLLDVTLYAEYWVADSQSITGCFSIQNNGSQQLQVRFDLYAHVIAQGKEQSVNVLTLGDGGQALYLGKLANIDPVVLMQDGTAQVDPDGTVRSKLGCDFDMAPGEKVVIRWAHAGLPDMVNSIRRARYWMGQGWENILTSINTASNAIPNVQTGNADWDATVAFSFQHLMQSVLSQTDALPHPSFVTSREPGSGYNDSEGKGYIREWSGQVPITAYVISQSLATIAPEIAEGIIRNYLAVQRDDGWIDWSPGLGGQRRDMLLPPILARMAWGVYQRTGNETFIRDVQPSVLKFFHRWFHADMDTDGDGVPEWRDINQTGYAGWPLFVGGVDISLTETPDMIAYLLSEALALREMSKLLNDETNTTSLSDRISNLQSALDDLWQQDHFIFRDRDTHVRSNTVSILQQGRGDEDHSLNVSLDEPARLVLEIIGGAGHRPKVTIKVDGIDAEGHSQKETIAEDRIIWSYGRGTVTTNTIFTRVDHVRAEGLSRVYRLSVYTAELDDGSLNTLLPIFSGGISSTQADAIVRRLKDSLLKSNGIALFPSPILPGQTVSGVWVYWNSLVIEGLLQYGYGDLAMDVLSRLLNVQTTALRKAGKFPLFYSEEELPSVSDRFDLNGIVPLYLLDLFFGISMHPDGSVMVSQHFYWKNPVTIKQYGIEVKRDSAKTVVTYPGASEDITIPGGASSLVRPPISVEQHSPKLDIGNKPNLIAVEQQSTPIKIVVDVEDDIPE